MNNLTSTQRKYVYMGGIIALMVAVITLGKPPSSDKPGSGGTVSTLREKYDLGEATLGNVDPASSTMNLVLLGFRGIAASILWNEHENARMHKDWSLVQRTADSITLLQPHFKKVWEYQAWNLGFNVSAECDAVEDRFYWVKQGAKYLKRGTERNNKFPELLFECGRFFGQKIGRADEKEQFRKFFVADPDKARWQGKADSDINPLQKDNFLVARDWYQRANSSIEDHDLEQHKMDLPLFWAYPTHSMMDYAEAREEDGIFDAAALQAWADAFKEWTEDYGRRTFTAAGNGARFTLEGSEAELAEMAKLDSQSLDFKKTWQDRYRAEVNYNFWKLKCQAEQKQSMLNVRRDFFDGKKAFKERGNYEEAGTILERALTTLLQVSEEFGRNVYGKYELVYSDGDLTEEAIKAILILERVRDGLPEQFPMKEVWDDPYFEGKRAELREKFNRWAGN
jgi:hypothetical protein